MNGMRLLSDFFPTRKQADGLISLIEAIKAARFRA
jgi:hypothetical protein